MLPDIPVSILQKVTPYCDLHGSIAYSNILFTSRACYPLQTGNTRR